MLGSRKFESPPPLEKWQGQIFNPVTGGQLFNFRYKKLSAKGLKFSQVVIKDTGRENGCLVEWKGPKVESSEFENRWVALFWVKVRKYPYVQTMIELV